MSDLALLYVREFSPVRGTDYAVLEQIAEHVHQHRDRCSRNCDRGGVAWPSIATLAAGTRLDRRTVQRSLRRLEAVGVITVERTGRSSDYRIPMPDLDPVDNLCGEPVEADVAPVAPLRAPGAHVLSEAALRRFRGGAAPPDLVVIPREGSPSPPDREVDQGSGGRRADQDPAGAGAHPQMRLRGCKRHQLALPTCSRCRDRVDSAAGRYARLRATDKANDAAREARRRPGGRVQVSGSATTTYAQQPVRAGGVLEAAIARGGTSRGP